MGIDLRRAMKNVVGTQLTDEDIDTMIRTCNKDNDGYIAPAELRRIATVVIAELTNEDVDKIIVNLFANKQKIRKPEQRGAVASFVCLFLQYAAWCLGVLMCLGCFILVALTVQWVVRCQSEKCGG